MRHTKKLQYALHLFVRSFLKKQGIFSCILLSVSLFSYSQPKVYFNFLSHNEETFQWNNNTFYTANRAKLISLADYFQNRGITWNMQSDWVYLLKVLGEDSTLTSSTNYKSILRWMWEDKGVEMDPHAHESQYIYPDLVHLMDSIGLPESKVMGGTLYNQSNGINVWTNLINGQNGLVFPNKFWQPDYMMGGGTPNHVADLNYYGFWNPQDTANYLTHFPANHLRHIGVGCEMKIWDTTTVSVIVAELHDVVQKVQSGQYPSNGFYLQTIFFEQGDLNSNAFFNKVISVADSVNAIVVAGNAEWKTLKQAYTLWDSILGAQMFQWECGSILTNLTGPGTKSKGEIYPNPFTGSTSIRLTTIPHINCEMKISDLTGRQVGKHEISNQITEFSAGSLCSGIYIYQITDGFQIISSGKLVIE